MPLDVEGLRRKLGLKDDATDALAALEELAGKYDDLEEGNSKLRAANRKLGRKKGGMTAEQLRQLLDADADDLDDDDPLQAALAEMKKGREADSKAAAALLKKVEALEKANADLAADRERAAKRTALDGVLGKLVREDLRDDAFEKLSGFIAKNGNGYVPVDKDGNPLKTKDGKPVDLPGLVADLKTGELTGVSRPSYLLSHEGQEHNTGPAPPSHLPGASARSMTRSEMREKHGPK